MKKIIKTVALLFIFTISIAFMNAKTISAKEHESSLSIPDRIISYANTKKTEVINELVQENIITDDEDIQYALPYIIYYPEVNQEAIYYFPLIKDENIVMMVTIIDTEEGLILQSGEEMVEELNAINYLETNYIFYEYEYSLYAENKNEKICLYSYGIGTKIYSETERKKELKFFKKSYKKKKSIINEKIKNMRKCTAAVQSDEEKLQMLMKGTLALHNPRGQYEYGMCWAAAVATVVNYKQQSGITAFEVCNRMGRDYNRGGTIYDEQDALSKYNVTYGKVRLNMLTWNQIKSNISSKNPIIINLICNDNSQMAHTVTIYGYTADNKIKYWDSYVNNGNGKKMSVLYSKASSNFLVIKGHSYSWGTSLSVK